VEAGEIASVDAEEFAVTFSCLLDGLSIQVALRDPVVDPDRALRVAMSFAASELGFEWKPRRGAAGGAARATGRSARR
jgi:hypothetical protein